MQDTKSYHFGARAGEMIGGEGALRLHAWLCTGHTTVTLSPERQTQHHGRRRRSRLWIFVSSWRCGKVGKDLIQVEGMCNNLSKGHPLESEGTAE